jgi:hypothetical protein
MPRKNRASYAAALVPLALLAIQGPAAAVQHSAVEFVKPRQQLAYFEVYHIRHENILYRAGVSLEALLAKSQVQDYVRIDGENREAVADLYQALTNTATEPTAECSSDSVDTRWAIVLHFRDQTKEAIGFGPAYLCIRILSRTAPVVATTALLKFVEKSFPFMH